jgi:hypothetical protein
LNARKYILAVCHKHVIVGEKNYRMARRVITVCKTYSKYLITLLYGIAAFFMFVQFQAPLAHAAGNPQLTLTLPNGNTQLVGHPGTRVHISGSGFPSGALMLYTTADPNKCAQGDANLVAFDTNPKVSVKGNGNFQLNSSWPTSASTATTAYYLCAIDSNGNGTASNTPFTVAQPVTLTIQSVVAQSGGQSTPVTANQPVTVQPGGQITLTGSNWLPSQAVNVGTNILATGGQSYVGASTTPDAQGSFSVTLTIPADAAPGNYFISATAPNEPTQWMQIRQTNAITIVPGTATATATVATTPTTAAASTPTVTGEATATPTSPSSGGGTGGGSIVTMLIFVLSGAGVLFIIVGVIIWAAGRSG